MRKDHSILIGELNGRNGADPPLAVPDDQAVEMLNVDRYDGMIGRKRPGSDAVTETGGTAFSSGLQSLFRFVPGADETLAEFWGIDGAATPIAKRMVAGTAFANVTVDDAISTRPQDVVGATLNGKLYLAYDSTQDRLHCYDPLLSSPRVRRVGLTVPAAPVTTDSGGGGAYPAVLRYTRIRWLQLSGTVIIRRSEPSASTSFTPAGAFTTWRINRPALANEGETHWETEVSTDNATWYVLYGQGSGFGAAQTVATTTIDESTTKAVWEANSRISEPAGYYSLFPSVKTILSDGNRLLGAGAWESAGATSGGKNSRVWYTPVLGSADKGDDERVPNQTNQKNWVDLNENDGGGVIGLGGPLNGIAYAFKYRDIWRMTPTGDVTTPYLPKKIISGIGCIAHKTITMGIDEAGRPALYFLSHMGAYRFGANGLQYLWRDNEDITVNLGASTVVAHSVYYHDLHQWWLWIATGSSNDPDTLMVFDPLLGQVDDKNRVRKGWFKWTGNLAGARCATLFANTLGASMSRDLKPYIGRSTGTTINKGGTSATSDAGTAYQAYVQTKPLAAAPLGSNGGVADAQLLAKVAAGVTITLSLLGDYGLQTARTSSVLLTAAGSETRLLKKFEDSAITNVGTIQAQIGDGSALASSWVLDALVLPSTEQERR